MYPILREIRLEQPFMTEEAFWVVLNLAKGRKKQAMRRFLTHPWQDWRPLLLDVLEILSYERAAGGLAMLRACMAEAAYSHRMSPEGALMAACLMNCPGMVTSLLRQSGQFLWAPIEGKDCPGWTHRALFLMSAAPKEFAEALPFQYYQALNHAARFAHPMVQMGRFADEFVDTLLRYWDPDSDSSAGSSYASSLTTRSADGSDSDESDMPEVNDPASKYHRYPKILAGMPLAERPVPLDGSLNIHDTPVGRTVMSNDVAFRWIWNQGPVPQVSGLEVPGDAAAGDAHAGQQIAGGDQAGSSSQTPAPEAGGSPAGSPQIDDISDYANEGEAVIGGEQVTEGDGEDYTDPAAEALGDEDAQEENQGHDEGGEDEHDGGETQAPADADQTEDTGEEPELGSEGGEPELGSEGEDELDESMGDDEEESEELEHAEEEEVDELDHDSEAQVEHPVEEPLPGSPSVHESASQGREETVETGEQEEQVEDDEASDPETAEEIEDTDEYKEDVKKTGKRKREPTPAETWSPRRLRTRVASKPPPPPPPPPPKRKARAKPQTTTAATKSTGSRKRKTTGSEPPEETPSPPPKQRKKNPPKATAAPKATKRGGRK